MLYLNFYYETILPAIYTNVLSDSIQMLHECIHLQFDHFAFAANSDLAFPDISRPDLMLFSYNRHKSTMQKLRT